MQKIRQISLFAALTVAILGSTANPAVAQQVRVRINNVCGSGSVCGWDGPTAYILTNAHVAGSRIGRQVNIDYQTAQGQQRTIQATIVAAAYSSQNLTDWAILTTTQLPAGWPVWKLSTRAPVDARHRTCGSPRCVWPQVCQDVTTVSVNNRTGLWLKTPNAVGGMSGSSVHSTRGITHGIVTWSWGGRCASQTTAQIAKQIRDRNTDAEPRPVGIQEVTESRSPTEDGFFAQAATDFPIWDEDKPQEPKPSKDPLREAATAAGFDYNQLVTLILELIRLIRR